MHNLICWNEQTSTLRDSVMTEACFALKYASPGVGMGSMKLFRDPYTLQPVTLSRPRVLNFFFEVKSASLSHLNPSLREGNWVKGRHLQVFPFIEFIGVTLVNKIM